ncbi:uncharacterized protein LOC124362313 isoform X2 [Homalodisca vitripennis]|uniref:uncharacterized protein LOC124362313 isoform X2 n=1 Tax=Homalodisca vitripennis TaxID=197043 RepID=UPI001EEA296C|nr:uncharacterized protein LOC124362313 isoform X2 [Homalodisca vitripennis]
MSSPSKPKSPTWKKRLSTKKEKPACEIMARTEPFTADKNQEHPSESDPKDDDLLLLVQNTTISNSVKIYKMVTILQEMLEQNKKLMNLIKAKNQNETDEICKQNSPSEDGKSATEVNIKATTNEVYKKVANNEVKHSFSNDKLNKIYKQNSPSEDNKKATEINKKATTNEVDKKAATSEVKRCTTKFKLTQDHFEKTNLNSQRKRKLSSSAVSDPQAHMKKSRLEDYQEQDLIPTNLRSKLINKEEIACTSHTCTSNFTSETKLEETRQCQAKDLISSDNNLEIKVAALKQSNDCIGFRQWIKCNKEQQLSMNGLEPKQHLPTIIVKESSNLLTDNSDVPLRGNKWNVFKVHSQLEKLMVDLQAFLHAVLKKAMQNPYGDLKHHTNNINPSWTLIDYIVETNKRWSMITSCDYTPRIRNIFSKLIVLVKKYRRDKEDFTVADIDSTFSLCQDVANLVSKKYVNSTVIFLRNLTKHRNEWVATYKSTS